MHMMFAVMCPECVTTRDYSEDCTVLSLSVPQVCNQDITYIIAHNVETLSNTFLA